MSATTALATYISICGVIWVIFTRTELLLNGDGKALIYKWINTPNYTSILSSWSPSFIHLFDSIFGKNHLSFKCFVRSSIASISFVILLGIIWYLKIPDQVSLSFGPSNQWGYERTSVFTHYGILFEGGELFSQQFFPLITILLYPLVFNLVPDYLSLLQTRFLIKLLPGSSVAKTILYLVIDFILTMAITMAALYFMTAIAIFLVGKTHLSVNGIYWNQFTRALSLFSDNPKPYQTILGVYLYTSLLTSVWIWLYILGGILNIYLRKIDAMHRFIKRYFTIAQHPLTSIGWLLITGISMIFVPIIIIIYFVN